LERDALIVKLLEENSELKAKIAELERRLNQNS
jgi:cell division septum initiation protein DivIVA